MSDRYFFDTNVLVYAKLNIQDLTKQKIAQDLLFQTIEKENAYISVQVLEEFINCSMKKARKSLSQIENIIDEMLYDFCVINLTSDLVKDAIRISEVYGFSFYDSLVVSAALFANCNVLYTEDLQDGQMIDGVLKIVNPFSQQN